MTPGTIVAGGKYRVERNLGRGGMGIVVEAVHVQLGNRVALKFLDSDLAREPTSVARFLREAKACAQLRGEHVCRVSDYGVEGNVPFIVMELLDGVDLAKLVRSRPLDIATAAQYVMQACTGLAEAHAMQIVHRDLKPANLFLASRPDGTKILKVVDFGVAKADGIDPGLTGTSSVVGSPGFMAPEQLRSSKSVDTRADIWSLGVILYKLVSGRVPFSSDSFAEFALAIVREVMPPLTEAPPGLAAIVGRCLEKDPAARYQTVGELSAALAPFATGKHAMATIVESTPAVPRTPTPPTRAARPAKAATGTLLGGSGIHEMPQPDAPATMPDPPAHARETLYSEAVAVPDAQPGSEEILAPGTIVGEYRIERKIGEGGMGVVYAAIHPLIGKKAAIKVISGGLGADRDAVNRFVQEARSVNQIGHPNIVDVFAFGVLPDGRNYFVMEQLTGESLRERLARTSLSLGDALEILDEITGALEAAHEKKIVHRDLKPDNIFLASMRGGRIIVKLLDFGIAKLAVAEGATNGVAKTRTGMMMGTPAYLSPEQARGQNVTHSTDIYALGCMIYEICTGRLPFIAPSAMDVVLMHIKEPVRPPSELWPHMPRRLEVLVMRMLEKEPHRRPSLAEVRHVFTELITTGEVTIEAGSGTFRSDLRSRRNSEMPTPTPIVTPLPRPLPLPAPAATHLPAPAPAEPSSEPTTVAPRRSRGRLWLVLGAILLGSAAGAVLVSMRTGDKPVAAVARDAAIVAPDARVIVVAIDAAPAIAIDAPAAASGYIQIYADADNAEIQVDGVAVVSDHGTARIPQAAGSHHVVIGAPDRGEYDTTVQVVGDATVTLTVRLEHVKHSTTPPPPHLPHAGSATPKPPPPRSGSGSGSAKSGDKTIDPFAD